MSGDLKGEDNSSHEAFKNRDTEPFVISHEGNSMFKMSDSPTAAVETIVDGNLPENESAKTPRATIPIVILTDLSKKYVKSRRLI